MHEATISGSTATNTDTPCHNSQLVGQDCPIGASENRALPHSTSTDSRCKQETRPTHKEERRSKRRRVTAFLARALHNLREAFVNYVSPARDGTGFLRNELQAREIADILYDDPGPWHEYGVLDSDVEDDRYYKSNDPKKRPRKWFQTSSDLKARRNETSSV
ncbi:hypothetical protein F5Y08DRAFT_339899 [Xylaria arbuscula]|nr:hypothetical protein F5Y08DRAFT_339899 [Xylaria arbuscula]